MIKQRMLSGIYSCDFRTPEGKRVRKSLHTRDLDEAKAMEMKLRYGTKETTKRTPLGTMTLSEAFTHALRVRDQWRSAKRLDSVELIYKSLEEHFGAECPLSRITDESLLDYAEMLRRRGRAPSTINKRLSLVSVLFDEAIKWKKYKGKKPTMVRYKVRNARRRLVTPAEEATAISLCIQSSPWEAAMADLIVILADTGMRQSEALRIQPRNVDVDNRAVLIVDTKNGDDRIVPLTGRAMEILARRNVAPVFEPLSPSVITHTWSRIREKMGLEKDKEFVLHAFRHTYGTTLANAGTDSFRLQKVMGHKSIQSTQRYIKVSASALGGLSSIIEQRTAKYEQEVSARAPSRDTPDK